MTALFSLPTRQRAADKKTLYTNVRLLDPESGLDQAGGEVLVIGNRVADFGANLFDADVPPGTEIIDCGGHLLTPGLLDIQVHFREPGQEYKETIATGSMSAAAGGVTTVACMPNTRPPVDNVALLDFVHKRAAETAYVNVRSYACITKAMQGKELTEMGLLVESGAVGFTDDGLPVMNAGVMRHALAYARELGVPVAQHAEDLHLSAGGCMNEGPVATRLGLKGIPNAAEAAMVERDILLAELTGGQYHVLHISTAEAIDAVRRAKKRGLRVTCEAAPHHFMLTDEALLEYRTFSKMNPPLRSARDRDAVIRGLQDGTIDAIATDHAPHDTESKRVPVASAAFGIVGLETVLPLSLALYHDGHMSLRDVLAALTYKPADIIHVEAGRIKKGAPADFTIIDPDLKWTIRNDDLSSKSKNSPFEGREVKGRAVRTVVGGETVYMLEEKKRRKAA